jgi:hypothetical protein
MRFKEFFYKEFILESVNSDEEYLKLTQDPEKNKEELQLMVTNSAKKAEYNVHAYHVTNTAFNIFRSTTKGRFGQGMYFSETPHTTRGKIVMQVFLKAPKTTEIPSPWKKESPKWRLPTNEYFVTNPNQIKSADLITYDDDGDIIPLSQRFDSSKDDIRY